MNKMSKGFIVISLLITFMISCETNKLVYLTPLEPFEFQENGITFSISGTQEYWIYFDPDKWPADFSIYIDTDTLPDSIKVNSLQMVINDLDLVISKSDLELTANIEEKSFNKSKKYRGQLDFRNIIFTSDIVNEYNRKYNDSLNSMKMYKKFKQVHEIIFIIDLIYSINGKSFSLKLNFKFKARKVNSNRLLDTIMSV